MKIKRFKLNALSAEGLRQKEMNAIMGGTRTCSCSCYWANQGGSSLDDNKSANYNLGDTGGNSTNGCNQYFDADTAHIDYTGEIHA